MIYAVVSILLGTSELPSFASTLVCEKGCHESVTELYSHEMACSVWTCVCKTPKTPCCITEFDMLRVQVYSLSCV